MPFLRRRGIMASETDMRRHTSAIEPDHPPRKSQSRNLPTPDPAANFVDAHERILGDKERWEDGEGNKSSVDASPPRQSRDPVDRPVSPPIQDATAKHRRFSMLRFRNASDSQLSTRLRQQQQQQVEKPPPMPQPPAIITTAPTIQSNALSKKQSRVKVPIRIRRSADIPRSEPEPLSRLKLSANGRKEKRKTMNERIPSSPTTHSVTFEEPSRPDASVTLAQGPPQQNPNLPLPVNRLSESSRSEASSAEPGASLPTASSSSSLFRLPRRKQKQPEPLFPLAHLPQRSKTPALSGTASNTPSLPRDSTSTVPPCQVNPLSDGHDRPTPLVSPSHAPLSSGGVSGSPATALFRPSSRNSAQTSPTRTHLGALRGRSSTVSSLGRSSGDHHHSGTMRTSSSTGRKSFGDFLGLSRIRQNNDNSRQGSLTPVTPGSNTSKNNSLQIAREPIRLPERKEDDTPAKYLARVEESISRSVIASILSKETDAFSAAVLRSYMRSLSFFEEPMDMAIRKLLMEAELPNETQQIDRCLQAFANRYHECNPGIYSTPDQAYFIAFSLLILHTDVFNKNNKYKMQKADYLKNTKGEGIFDDVLECFYDNISYTPFIHVEDDLQTNGDRSGSLRSRKKLAFPSNAPEPLRRSKDPIDPYTLILDGKLDLLRPPLKDQIPLEEQYSYMGTAQRLNLKELQKTFFKTGVLQIVSARSRPDAFMTEKTANNPQEAHPGIVDIKVTKVGLLWRKDPKKKKTRSPWQEWGAILTGAQLYFFRNITWVKGLMHQYENHVRSGHDGIPLIFKPPLENFSPDTLMSTEGAVALWDTTYKKHKNAFVYVRHGGLEEVLLAQNEDDRNDWLAKLNYAAAFRTSGVRMRGVVGGNYEGQNRRAIRRLDSDDTTQLIQTPTGDVTINRGRIDHQMARDILVARRDVMVQKIHEAEEKLETAQRQLDNHLRNARHLLLLAPIQDKTRDQVRAGAAKVIAQLRWSRLELWRLKCHRDILALDLDEESEVNGDLESPPPVQSSSGGKPSHSHRGSRGSSFNVQYQSPRSPAGLSLSQSSESINQEDGPSPETDVFQTPPTSASAPAFRDVFPLNSGRSAIRKASVSSAASSCKPGAVSTPPRLASSRSAAQEKPTIDEQAAEHAREMRVLEDAGLLDVENARARDQRPSSSRKVTGEAVDPAKRSSVSGAEKDRLERSKIRRSLQRTLRDGAGQLSHHRSKKGKDSASSGALSDETVRDDILYRASGSFTVHGKKASIVNFGNELQSMSTDERMKNRRQGQQGDELGQVSPASDEDFQSVLGQSADGFDRRGSGASASTATARSFRELHRKYSSSRAHRSAIGNLLVPSDEDSDAAISFSDGRRSPLPPLDDEDEGIPTEQPQNARFYTPDPPGSPVGAHGPPDSVEQSDTEVPRDVERLPSPVVQAVQA